VFSGLFAIQSQEPDIAELHFQPIFPTEQHREHPDGGMRELDTISADPNDRARLGSSRRLAESVGSVFGIKLAPPVSPLTRIMTGYRLRKHPHAS